MGSEPVRDWRTIANNLAQSSGAKDRRIEELEAERDRLRAELSETTDRMNQAEGDELEGERQIEELRAEVERAHMGRKASAKTYSRALAEKDVELLRQAAELAPLRKLAPMLSQSIGLLREWTAEGCDCPPEGHMCGLPNVNRLIDCASAALAKWEASR